MFQENDTSFYRQAIKMSFILVALILACRFTKGYFSVVIALVGIGAALSNRRGMALAIYLLLPFFVTLNHLILPKPAILGLVARMGGALMILSMMVAANRIRGRETLPLGTIYLYLFCAALSSVSGYFPTISFLKILNCILFFFGLYYGTRNIHHQPNDVYLLRLVFFSFSLFILLGSLATLPFPAVAYYTSIGSVLKAAGETAALEMIQYHSESQTSFNLFTGVLNHSQFLAPMVSCAAGWVLCDMIAVEKKVRWLHCLMLAVAPPILFMTRSRAGFVSFVAMLGMVMVYCQPKLRLPVRLKRALQGFMLFGLAVLMVGAVVMEFRNHAMSRWLRKTDAVGSDRRSLGEAVTSSRMGKIGESLHDFRTNPLLGTGFQVTPDHRILYRMGAISLWAAPLERGFIITAILGETGILGLLMFLVFLCAFGYGCIRRGYHVTLTLFCVYLSTNLAEMTFFSPGGGGGIQWLFTVAGGFIIDLAAKGKVQILVMPVLPTSERPKEGIDLYESRKRLKHEQ